MVRSIAEMNICNWLFDHGVAHEYEPRYGDDVSWRADWKVNGMLIEYWGLCWYEAYRERREEKERYASERGIRLLGIEPGDDLDDILGCLCVAVVDRGW